MTAEAILSDMTPWIGVFALAANHLYTMHLMGRLQAKVRRLEHK